MTIEKQILHQEHIIALNEGLLYACETFNYPQEDKNGLLDNLSFAYQILKTLKQVKENDNTP